MCVGRLLNLWGVGVGRGGGVESPGPCLTVDDQTVTVLTLPKRVHCGSIVVTTLPVWTRNRHLLHPSVGSNDRVGMAWSQVPPLYRGVDSPDHTCPGVSHP